MSTDATKRAGLIATILTAGAVTLGIAAAAPANAVDGCPQGFYPTGGTCKLNAPGPWATPDPNNPECWFTSEGEKRCYLGADVFK